MILKKKYLIICKHELKHINNKQILTVVVSAGDMLRKTNKAEMQDNRVDRISGSLGSNAKHKSSKWRPLAMEGRSVHITIRLNTLSSTYHIMSTYKKPMT